MKKYLLFAVIVALLGSFGFLYAEEKVEGKKENASIVEDKGCIPLSDMHLSDGQVQAIETVRSSYRKKILQLRSNLMVKRIEFRNLLNDPQTGEKKLRAKAREIEKLNAGFERTVLNYQLEIRKVLSQDQIKSWCINEEMSSRREWK
jgi:Spy/CpxP family protein refolding chaperone